MKKRLLACMVALVLTASLLPLGAAQAAETATVKGGWLRMRASASYSAETVASYNTGTKLTVLGKYGDWYKVQAPDGNVGYMVGSYLTVSGSSSGGSASSGSSATVTSSNGRDVNLRQGPGMEYEVIGTYSPGHPATILSAGATWHYVKIGKQTGYMMAKYLKVSGGSSSGATDTLSPVNYTAYVTSSNGKGVNLRQSATTSSRSLGLYPVGMQMTVTGYSSSWCAVTIGSVKGYMMTRYITTTKPSTGVTPPPSSSYTAYVTSSNGKGVNLRQSPTTASKSVGQYPVGTQVTVTSQNGSWCAVTIGSVSGYMMTRYLTTTAPSTPSTPSTPSSYTAYVTSSNGKGVNLRQSATTSSRSLGLYPVGTEVTVVSRGDSWSLIIIGTTSGYMKNRYLTTTRPTPPSTGATVTGVALNNYTPSVGSVLSASLTPSGATVSYQWLDENGTVLSTSASYTVPSSMAGKRIRLLVVGYGTYSGSATTSYTMAVQSTTTQTVTGVTVSNTSPRVGDTLVATASPAGVSAVYAWYRNNGVQVSTNQSYTVQASDAGYSLYCVAVGTGKTTGSAASSYTNTVAASAGTGYKITAVTVSDVSPQVGDLLTAVITPSEGEAIYAWYRDDGTQVATTRTYTVQASDVGHSLYCVAVGTGNTTGSAASSYTNKVTSTTVALSGTVTLPNGAAVGTELRPTMTLSTTNVTYQWYQNGVLVGTGSTLVLTSSMAGDDIRLVVQAGAGSGYSGEVGSNYCYVQSGVNEGIPTITEL